MTWYFVAAGGFLLILLATIIGLFFKKSRRIAKYSLSAIAIILVVVAIVVLVTRQPLIFEKHYLASTQNITTLDLKTQAKKAGIYLGVAPSNAGQMQEPAFTHLFNSITPENDLKISHLLNIDTMEHDFTQADAMVMQAIQKDIRIRGHALVFGKLSDLYKKPDLDLWLTQFPEKQRREKLTELLDNHFLKVLNHYRGIILEWDVVNEPLAMFGNGRLEENVFYRYLGKEYIEQAFVKARAIDPTIGLYLNEQFYNYTDQRAEAFYQLVVSLLNKGVPIDGIGLQGHMLFNLASVKETADYVKRFTAIGLKVQITEFEARLRLFSDAEDPYLAQGEYYRDVMKACYAIEGFDGLTFWGVDDSRSWLNEMSWLFALPNEPYLLDAQKQAKPGLILINEWLKSY